VNETVLRRLMLRLTPSGLFACGAKIDDGAHVKLDGHQMLLLGAILARLVPMILRHAYTGTGQLQAMRLQLSIATESVAIPLTLGKTRLFE
jgi:hypothetical protein